MRTLAFALLASLLLWNLPQGGVLLYPFKLLATWLHELSHGLAMMITGAGFDHVLIYRDTSGLAYGQAEAGQLGKAVIAAAGYMGTPLWGAVMLVVTPSARMARWALLGLAGLLVGTAATVIDSPDGDPFGPMAVAAIGIACCVAALVTPGRWRLAIAHFIAAQSCVNAILDIRVLFRPSQVVGGQVAGASDAHNMAMATFGTAAPWAVWTWAILWLLWSLGVLYLALRVRGDHVAARLVRALRGEPDDPAPRRVPPRFAPRLAGRWSLAMQARSRRSAPRRSPARRWRRFRAPRSP
ncbi:MAG TPA: M50 family metallopeptidase [Kofleriaceae bacterium]|nr:M50 family metallopeptidase [Kofleriaceae bacterium]